MNASFREMRVSSEVPRNPGWREEQHGSCLQVGGSGLCTRHFGRQSSVSTALLPDIVI